MFISFKSVISGFCRNRFCVRFLIPLSVPYIHDLIIVFCVYQTKSPECAESPCDDRDPVSYAHAHHDATAFRQINTCQLKKVNTPVADYRRPQISRPQIDRAEQHTYPDGIYGLYNN